MGKEVATMNKHHLYFLVLLIVILCFSTTASALERQVAGYSQQWASAEKTQVHKGVMLVASAATELKPVLTSINVFNTAKKIEVQYEKFSE